MVWCGSDAEKIFETEPALRAVLPSDIGGDGEPLKDLIRRSKLVPYFALILPYMD